MSDAGASNGRVRDVLRAVAAGEFAPAYQPIVDLEDGAPVGVEALARWVHPTQGVLSPAAFSEALSEPEAAAAISDAILDQALADSVRFAASGFERLQISVNAAERQLLRADFAADVLRRAEARGAAPGLLLIELTEMVILSKAPAAIAAQLETLRTAGAQVAFDDFGTGFASLAHLKAFPIDRLKIDRSFIGALNSSAKDQAIVRAVLSMARELGMTVVAEGVEDAETAETLKTFGCRLGQGFFFAKPMLFDEATTALRSLAAPRGAV